MNLLTNKQVFGIILSIEEAVMNYLDQTIVIVFVILAMVFLAILGFVGAICYYSGKEEGRKEERRRNAGVE